jgi:hypothetical protein
LNLPEVLAQLGIGQDGKTPEIADGNGGGGKPEAPKQNGASKIKVEKTVQSSGDGSGSGASTPEA